MSKNDKYTSGNLLDYLYHQNYYKLFSIDLSRHANTTISLQINFTRQLEGGDGATMIFISEKQQKTVLNFSLNSLILRE